VQVINEYDEKSEVADRLHIKVVPLFHFYKDQGRRAGGVIHDEGQGNDHCRHPDTPHLPSLSECSSSLLFRSDNISIVEPEGPGNENVEVQPVLNRSSSRKAEMPQYHLLRRERIRRVKLARRSQPALRGIQCSSPALF
jgi:hypothetical protein